MKAMLAACALTALLTGCATEDLYEGRGSTPSGGTNVQSGSEVRSWETDFPRPPGSTPGTHPSDPRGGIGADDATRTRSP